MGDSVSNDVKAFESVERFLFHSPLYARYRFTAGFDELYELYGSYDKNGRSDSIKIDGYCLHCEKDTTFQLHPPSVPGGDLWRNLPQRHAFDSCSLRCGRNDSHRIKYEFYIKDLVVQKIGQFPSLADIAIGETKSKYRAVLRGDNWSELYRAIGLAAHGEGIGSFVYLRRIFERLIESRFNESKEKEGWLPEEFNKLRMDGKIRHLRNHLPSSLVDNSKLYTIFSMGIHQLTNERCLQFFQVGKGSIIEILEDDLREKANFERRKMLSDAIAAFKPEIDTA
jgi:hypothetical protein